MCLGQFEGVGANSSAHQARAIGQKLQAGSVIPAVVPRVAVVLRDGPERSAIRRASSVLCTVERRHRWQCDCTFRGMAMRDARDYLATEV